MGFRNLCKKHRDCHFWCRLEDGHDGCCVNGVSFSREPVRGTVEQANADIRQLRDSFKKVHRLALNERRKADRNMSIEMMADFCYAIEQRYELLIKLQQDQPVHKALADLLEWGRTHLSPVHDPGAHDLLVAAHNALGLPTPTTPENAT